MKLPGGYWQVNYISVMILLIIETIRVETHSIEVEMGVNAFKLIIT